MLDVRALHRHMSSPEWSAVQWTAAEQILAGTEQDLADALYGAAFEPFEHSETAPVDREGWVATSWPVFALIAVNGTPATDDTSAGGYRVTRHRLRSLDGSAAALGSGGPIVGPNDPRLTEFLPPRGLTSGAGHEDPWVSEVPVWYMAGWGPQPSLVNAILEKASVRMGNRHADTMVISGLSAQNGSGPARPWEWTDAELAPLGRYRNLGWGNLR